MPDTDRYREFPIESVLTVATGFCLYPGKAFGKVYELLNWMTRDNLFTHQLPRAMKECQPWLLRQHPQLYTIEASALTVDHWEEWLIEQRDSLGDTVRVERIPQDDHDRIDPVEELLQMRPDAVIVRTEPDDA